MILHRHDRVYIYISCALWRHAYQIPICESQQCTIKTADHLEQNTDSIRVPFTATAISTGAVSNLYPSTKPKARRNYIVKTNSFKIDHPLCMSMPHCKFLMYCSFVLYVE